MSPLASWSLVAGIVLTIAVYVMGFALAKAAARGDEMMSEAWRRQRLHEVPRSSSVRIQRDLYDQDAE